MTRPQEPKKTIRTYTTSLGCPKNRVDTEKMLGCLASDYQPCSTIQAADVILINTCGFIQPAVEESLETILTLAEEIRESSPKPLLVVTGCLLARYGQELKDKLPEVDLWISLQNQQHWDRIIRNKLGFDTPPPKQLQSRPGQEQRPGPPRHLSTGPGSAYLKISDGCRHNCSFCLIPQLRGPLLSTPLPDLIQEARNLLDQGVREIVLVAQDVCAYGQDLGLTRGLQELLHQLASLPGLQWLRLMYLYPSGLSEELLGFLKQLGPPFIPYFDIPLQHTHPDILKRMGRPFQVDSEAIIARIRNVFPDACLRSTFITGFPGEETDHFSSLVRFIQKHKLNHVGVFPFYPESGSSAAKLKPVVPEALRAERREHLLEIQAEISAQLLAETQGLEFDILLERPDPEWPTLFQGRTWFQAPEVDGITYISSLQAAPGDLIRSHIQESRTYDLIALDESGPKN